MKQTAQGVFKGNILLTRSFPGTFHPSAGGAELPGIVAHQKKGIDVIPGVFPAILVHRPGVPCKAHGGQTVILGDDDVAGIDSVYQRKIHTVGTFVKDQGLNTGADKFVGGIA